MITLKQALSLSKDDLITFRQDLIKQINDKKTLGSYIEQLTNKEITIYQNDGIPIIIKDNINVKGWEVTASSKILQNYIAPYNATVIEKLLTNNLTPFGRANMDEFAMGSSSESSCYGASLNPFDNKKVAGGSSGGTASAVGGGIAIAGLGTDTGGSIRQPASYCGCVGMKPTYGRVSRYGIIAYSSSLDQCGPITQNVQDCAILYDIISGYDNKDSTSVDISYDKIIPNLSSEKKLTIAIIDNFIDDADEDIKKAYLDTAKKLQDAGHSIVHKNMIDIKQQISSYYIIATAEASANLSRFDGIRYGNTKKANNLKQTYLDTRTQGFGEEVQRRILLGTFVLSSGYYDAYYIKAQKIRHLIKNNYDEIFQDCDLILSPVSPTTAPKLNSFKTPLQMYLSDIYTISVNLAGLPAISVPVSKDKDGMPIGLQLIGKSYEEQTMFDGAYALEKIINFKR